MGLLPSNLRQTHRRGRRRGALGAAAALARSRRCFPRWLGQSCVRAQLNWPYSSLAGTIRTVCAARLTENTKRPLDVRAGASTSFPACYTWCAHAGAHTTRTAHVACSTENSKRPLDAYASYAFHALASAHASYSYAFQHPNSCSRRLRQVVPFVTCTTPDLLLQH
jgi:hypothetical protein